MASLVVRITSTHILVAVFVLLGIVGLLLIGVSMRLDSSGANLSLLSRESIAMLDELIGAAAPGTLEVRARTSVTKTTGRATWQQGEFVLDGTAEAAALLQAQAASRVAALGLEARDEPETRENGYVVRHWVLQADRRPLVRVAIRVVEPGGERDAAAGQAPAVGGVAPDGAQRMEAKAAAFARPPAIRACPPRVAIIIDDVGYVWTHAMAFLEFDRPLTLALFPNLKHSEALAAEARKRHREFIMHLPMESGASRVNPGTLRTNMAEAEIAFAWEEAHRTTPGIVGVNNHQGSVMTADAEAMERILVRIRADHLYYIDSRTTAATVARKTAEELGMLTTENDIFLDNVKDLDYVKQKCRDLLALALVQGEAVGIGHAHPVTLQALQEVLPEYDAAGVQLVYASTLVQ